MAKIYFENEVKLELVKGKKTAVVGQGNQGYEAAINLSQMGIDVLVGINDSSELWQREDLKLELMSVGEAVKVSDALVMLSADSERVVIIDYIDNSEVNF